MRYITGIILLALSLSIQSFSAEKPVYVGRTSQLLPDDLKHIKLSSTFPSSEAEARLVRSQKGKWCFSFDTPVDLHVIIRRESSSLDGASEQKHRISRSASPMHDFMLARGVFRAEVPLSDDSTIKRYREDFSFYDHQDGLTKETTTDRSGIFYATTTKTTSYGMGLRGSYPRNFNKPMEDETDVSIEHVFSQDIRLSIGEEYQIYRTHKEENEFISISILFKQPEETSLNQQAMPSQWHIYMDVDNFERVDDSTDEVRTEAVPGTDLDPSTIIGPLGLPVGEHMTIEGKPCAVGFGGVVSFQSLEDVSKFGVHSLEVHKVNGVTLKEPAIITFTRNAMFIPAPYYVIRGYQTGEFGPGNPDPEDPTAPAPQTDDKLSFRFMATKDLTTETTIQ